MHSVFLFNKNLMQDGAVEKNGGIMPLSLANEIWKGFCEQKLLITFLKSC